MFTSAQTLAALKRELRRLESRRNPSEVSDEDLQREWLAAVKQIGPLYPGMAFLRAETRPTYPGSENLEVVVIYKGSDRGGQSVSSAKQRAWGEQIYQASLPLQRKCGYQRSFRISTH